MIPLFPAMTRKKKSISRDDDSAVERAILASATVIFSGGGNMPFQCPICLDCTDSSNIATVSGILITFATDA